MKRAALYVRVSTAEQEKNGISVDAQIDALQTYCKNNNLVIAGIYNDAGISGRKSYKKRPALLELISDCQQKKIDLILFTKLDRFFRSVPDYYECMAQIGPVPWRAIWEDYETETSQGQFVVNIMLSIAQQEADRTSERIRAVKTYQREVKGEYVSAKAPVGYLVDHNHIIRDHETEETMIWFWQQVMFGTPKKDICHGMTERGIHCDMNRFDKMRKNPAYCGRVTGMACEPYISEEDFDRIISRQRTRSARSEDRVYIFSGVCRCGVCGKSIVGKVHSRVNQQGIRIDYKSYICTGHRVFNECPGYSLSEAKLEEQLLSAIAPAMNAYNVRINEQNQNTDSSRQIARLNKKLDRLKDLYIEGDISEESYRKKRDDIQAQLSGLQKPQDKPLKPLPGNWREIYEDLDLAHRRAFWRSSCRYIKLWRDQEPEFVF